MLQTVLQTDSVREQAGRAAGAGGGRAGTAVRPGCRGAAGSCLQFASLRALMTSHKHMPPVNIGNVLNSLTKVIHKSLDTDIIEAE